MGMMRYCSSLRVFFSFLRVRSSSLRACSSSSLRACSSLRIGVLFFKEFDVTDLWREACLLLQDQRSRVWRYIVDGNGGIYDRKIFDGGRSESSTEGGSSGSRVGFIVRRIG